MKDLVTLSVLVSAVIQRILSILTQLVLTGSIISNIPTLQINSSTKRLRTCLRSPSWIIIFSCRWMLMGKSKKGSPHEMVSKLTWKLPPPTPSYLPPLSTSSHRVTDLCGMWLAPSEIPAYFPYRAEWLKSFSLYGFISSRTKSERQVLFLLSSPCFS